MWKPADFTARFWRDRAQEARARAEQMHDMVAKRTMELIADAYECLAQRAETVWPGGPTNSLRQH